MKKLLTIPEIEKGGLKMRKSFTLMEIMIVCIIILILATLGALGYRQLLESAKDRVCAVNQETLIRTIQIASIEAGVLGKLENLDLKYLGNTYAQIMKKQGWFTKLSYFFVKINTPSFAYAAVEDFIDPVKMKKYGLDAQLFICPSSEIPYAINEKIEGLAWQSIPAGTIILGDFTATQEKTFTNLNNLNSTHYKFGNSGQANIAIKEGIALGVKLKNNNIEYVVGKIDGETVNMNNSVIKQEQMKVSSDCLDCIQGKGCESIRHHDENTTSSATTTAFHESDTFQIRYKTKIKEGKSCQSACEHACNECKHNRDCGVVTGQNCNSECGSFCNAHNEN